MAHCTDAEAGDEVDHGSELSDNDDCRRRDVEQSSTATRSKAMSTTGTHY